MSYIHLIYILFYACPSGHFFIEKGEGNEKTKI